jgi:hypothetical protein
MAGGRVYLRLECPGCRRRLKIATQHIGQGVECKRCTKHFEVPDTAVIRCPHCDRKSRFETRRWGSMARCGRCEEAFPIEGTATIPGSPGPPRRHSRPSTKPADMPHDAGALRVLAEQAEGELVALRRRIEHFRESLLTSDLLVSTICERAREANRLEADLAESRAEVDLLRATLSEVAHRPLVSGGLAGPVVQAEGGEESPTPGGEGSGGSTAASEIRDRLEEAMERERCLEALVSRLRGEIEDERETNRLERDELVRKVDESARSLEASARDVSHLRAECDRLAAACETEASARRVEVETARDASALLAAELERATSALEAEAAARRDESEAALDAQSRLVAERDRLAAGWRAEAAARRDEAATARESASRLAAERDEILRRARDSAALAQRSNAEVAALRAEVDRLRQRLAQGSNPATSSASTVSPAYQDLVLETWQPSIFRRPSPPVNPEGIGAAGNPGATTEDPPSR